MLLSNNYVVFYWLLFLIIRILVHLHFPFLCLIVTPSCTTQAQILADSDPDIPTLALHKNECLAHFFVAHGGSHGGSGSDACLLEPKKTRNPKNSRTLFF